MTLKTQIAKRKTRKYSLVYTNPVLSEVLSGLFDDLIFEEIPKKYFEMSAGDYFANDRVCAIWEGEHGIIIAFFKDRS